MREPLNRPTIVSFSGVDGAGKSTQIEALTTFLKKVGVTYQVYTFWDDVVALASFRERVSQRVFKGDQGVGSPSNPLHRRDKNVTTWYSTLARFVLYALDVIKLRAFVRGLGRHTELVIFDRYLYDELANLPVENKISRLYISAILRIVPVPDVAMLLDADPESASCRKPEYPIEFVKQNRAAYMALSRASDMFVLPPGEIHQTSEAVRSLVYPQGLQPDHRFPPDSWRKETSIQGHEEVDA